ncbi:NADH:ubiquinone reductase (Na(+)-transporting) subunit B [Stratiformator vulcanicus]|uniref:Na(+)-translocating NADH-quinone reductase subunit B n=1 Tax=Stratiformator vulcanicus TaxID=2527980 RepID=A0A517QW70_9PLAN|nr:NADH:ubiquinone reductase (Na(+)-transporting) subunit B [Stratiformator vulcanicus]QDT35854.1 Na(+)-translocating NADH-quinone reductase subunit B [Stratiformator vulcanicus]
MKPLRKALDSVEPLFKKGGKLEMLYPLYEAGDTFLYTPGEVTSTGSHVRDGIDLKRMMSLVIVALMPAILFGLWNTGYQANIALQHDAPAFQAAAPEGTTITYEETEGGLYNVSSVTGSDWHYWIIELLGIGYSPDNPLACIIQGAVWFLPIYIITLIAGGTCEAIFAVLRGHEINEGFLVTSMLYPLTLPATIPLWQVALGIIFGVVIGKEIFGGTGKNFLNIALTSRAFLYFAYPGEVIGDKVWNAASQIVRQPDGTFATVDGWSSATMLTWLGANGGSTLTDYQNWYSGMGAGSFDWFSSFIGTIPGCIGSTSALACLIGAAILIGVGIGSWRIMLGCVIGLVATTLPLWLIGSETNAMFQIPPWYHLVIGGFAFGAVYMATDPVSASMTNTGRWWYGILIGFMTALIRVINPAYPEGIMLAILFGNVFAPLIDYFVVQANIQRRLARVA